MSQVYKADINGDGSTPTPQGFLDYEGVKHLWSKVSMKDYPNNETLAAVINAIDETKADKSELFSGSWNDLSDKPFFDNEDIICDGTMDISEYSYPDDSQTGSISLLKDIQKLEIGTLQAIIDGIEYTVTIGENNLSYDDNNIGPIYLKYDIYRQRLNLTSFGMYFPFSTLKLFSKEFKQLDSKFIGPDIARVSDIPVDTVTNSELHAIAKSGSWNDLEDKPFYEESRILYDGYPSYKWGYAKLPFVLKDGVRYSIGYYISDDSVAIKQHIAESNDNEVITINFTDSIEGTESFRLECNPEESYSYFYGDGTLWGEGKPETSEDGSYAYLSHVKLQIAYVDDKDVDVVTLNEKFIPDTIARTEDIITPVQSDWNESNENSLAYIKNKTHYEIEAPIIYYSGENASGQYIFDYVSEESLYFTFEDNTTIKLNCSEVTNEGHYYYRWYKADNFEVYIGYESQVRINKTPNNMKIIKIASGSKTQIILKQLDSKFIPSDIPRYNDIPQSNWLENSSESTSYIQNKPFYEGTKYLLQSQTTFNCSKIHSNYYPYYTDKNNYIYTALEVGKTYGISYVKDFGEYKDWSWIELTAQDVGGNIAIGNLSIMNNDNHNYEDTGEEFVILWLINHDYGIICTKEPKEIEIDIISTNELKQLDDKFISDNIARVSDIPVDTVTNSELHSIAKSGNWDDLEDKPFYKINNRVLIAKKLYKNGIGGPFEGAVEGYGDAYGILKVSDMIPGDTYTMIVNGVEYTAIAERCEDTSSEGNNGITLFSHGEFPEDFSDAPASFGSYGNGVYVSFENEGESYDIELYHVNTELKTLDEKFISSNIARISQLPIDKVFEVKYEVHDIYDVTEAYEDNKLCYVIYNGETYFLTSYNWESQTFTSPTGHKLFLSNDYGWESDENSYYNYMQLNYYTKSEIDTYELITTADIDAICGAQIVNASEVNF